MKKPLSLLQHFDAPEQYLGQFGWVCGYSADALFMDMAVERFSRLTSGQRASNGRPLMALMTDPDHPPISMLDAPGLAHLPWKAGQARPFRLQHAKVAVLGFRHETEMDCWKVRLIISTGNWTQQTVEEGLDLVFRLDVDSSETANNFDDKALQKVCADIGLSWEVLQWLQSHYDTRVLDAARAVDTVSLTRQSLKMLNGWLNSVVKLVGDDAIPRVFHNRKRSLLSQLPELIREHTCGDARNYLAMGSGFYEGGKSPDQVPSVLQLICNALVQENLLQASPIVDVVINPVACQSIAHARNAMVENGFTLRPATQSGDIFASTVRRTFHAKFLFGTTHKRSGTVCHKPWLYLGSGNLTGPGFANTMSKLGGNLEVGVVFDPGKNLVFKRNAESPESYLGNCLPFDPAGPALDTTLPLQPGDRMPEPEFTYLSPPVAWLIWSEGKLHAPDSDNLDWCILKNDGEVIPASASRMFDWPGERPRQVRIAWPADTRLHHADVPVLDELGRLAASKLNSLEIEEAVWQLMSFPMLPAEDRASEDPEDDGSDESGASGSGSAVSRMPEQPIRKMMFLIEEIAARQTEVAKADWLAWCARLEQTLHQMADDPNLLAFKDIGLNPLSPLWHAPFRPLYAENGTTNEGCHYESMLTRITSKWGVSELKNLGDAS